MKSKLFPTLFTLVLLLPVLVRSQTDTTVNIRELADKVAELNEKVNHIKPALSRFMLTGYANAAFRYDSKMGLGFESASFTPIFLWKPAEKIFFEGELEMEFEDGELKFGLEYADIAYQVGKSNFLRAGKIIVPFGIFSDRLHAAWINKFIDKPLGFDPFLAGPGSDLGLEFRGGAQIGTAKLNYSLYVVNGPSINDGTTSLDEAGKLNFVNNFVIKKIPAAGGRLGILPISNSSLEIGVSGQYTNAAAKNSKFKRADNYMYAVDLTYVKAISEIKGLLDFKAQFNGTSTQRLTYGDSTNTLNFSNRTMAYFVQLAYRPALVKNKILKRFEIAARFSALQLPKEVPWYLESKQVSAGINYWINWRSVIKLNYQYTDQKSAGEPEISHAIILQTAIGF